MFVDKVLTNSNTLSAPYTFAVTVVAVAVVVMRVARRKDAKMTTGQGRMRREKAVLQLVLARSRKKRMRRNGL